MTIDVTVNGETTSFSEENNPNTTAEEQSFKAWEHIKEAASTFLNKKQEVLTITARYQADPPTLGIHVSDNLDISDLFGRK